MVLWQLVGIRLMNGAEGTGSCQNTTSTPTCELCNPLDQETWEGRVLAYGRTCVVAPHALSGLWFSIGELFWLNLI
jgi:hypothetical protein